MSYSIGTEKTVSYNGHQYIKLKIDSNPSKWVFKHVYVYEQACGKIKDSEVVTFLDGNSLNCDLENLIAIDRRIFFMMVRKHFPQSNKEETLVSIGLAKLIAKIVDIEEEIEEEKEWEEENLASDKTDYKQKYREIGLKITYYRKLKGYTRQQLSEETGIKINYLQNLENPNKHIEPSLDILFRISDVLKIKAEKLLESINKTEEN